MRVSFESPPASARCGTACDGAERRRQADHPQRQGRPASDDGGRNHVVRLHLCPHRAARGTAGALRRHAHFVQWVSQTFIQLVMLSVIMVGQNILGRASDKRAEMTYKDAEATFHEGEQIQAHLKVQDEAMTVILSRLEALDTWAARSADSRRVGLNHPHTVSATHGSGPLTGVSAPGNAPPPRRPVSAARHPISP
jgi:hypothetical protein